MVALYSWHAALANPRPFSSPFQVWGFPGPCLVWAQGSPRTTEQHTRIGRECRLGPRVAGPGSKLRALLSCSAPLQCAACRLLRRDNQRLQAPDKPRRVTGPCHLGPLCFLNAASQLLCPDCKAVLVLTAFPFLHFASYQLFLPRLGVLTLPHSPFPHPVVRKTTSRLASCSQPPVSLVW